MFLQCLQCAYNDGMFTTEVVWFHLWKSTAENLIVLLLGILLLVLCWLVAMVLVMMVK